MADVPTLVTIASAVALAALGTLLLLRRGRTATTNELATFVLGLAGLYVSEEIDDIAIGSFATAFNVGATAVYVVAVSGLVRLILLVPWPLRVDERRTRLWIVAAVLASLAYASFDLWTSDWMSLVNVAEPARSMVMLTTAALHGAYAGFVIMLVFRGAWSEHEQARRGDADVRAVERRAEELLPRPCSARRSGSRRRRCRSMLL